MFTIFKLESCKTRVGLNWAVIKANYAGNKGIVAVCKTEANAQKIADAMNATASVSITEKEVAA